MGGNAYFGLANRVTGLGQTSVIAKATPVGALSADCVEKLGNWATAKISLSRASRHLSR